MEEEEKCRPNNRGNHESITGKITDRESLHKEVKVLENQMVNEHNKIYKKVYTTIPANY